MTSHLPLTRTLLAVATLLVPAGGVAAQQGGMEVTNPRRADEGDGPHDRLILRGATYIDGAGSPPLGPVDIVIENDRIAEIRSVGFPMSPIDEDRRPDGATREIDVSGMYILPGLVDMHAHTGGAGKAPQSEYTYKLWMGNGITTSRGVGHGPMMCPACSPTRAPVRRGTAERSTARNVPASGCAGQRTSTSTAPASTGSSSRRIRRTSWRR
jgi:imidazolonepropionase-like amidohydrolase